MAAGNEQLRGLPAHLADCERALASVRTVRGRSPVLFISHGANDGGAVEVHESDPVGAANLEKIDHVVVVMLENRSFDHMLGYLSLSG
jgi:phospholipase C